MRTLSSPSSRVAVEKKWVGRENVFPRELKPLHSVPPSNIWRAPNLQIFSASSGQLTGKIPDFIGCKSLYKIAGFIPATLGRLQGLKTFDLSDNQLSGSIPPEIVTLKGLTNISLMNNFLVGEIPKKKMGELPNLENLLWNNSLKGVLPQSLGFSGKLLRVDVSSNSLTGTIPKCLGNLTELTRLELAINPLKPGELPSEIGNLTKLQTLFTSAASAVAAPFDSSSSSPVRPVPPHGELGVLRSSPLLCPVPSSSPALKSPCSSRRKAMEMLLRGDKSILKRETNRRFRAPRCRKREVRRKNIRLMYRCLILTMGYMVQMSLECSLSR